MNIDRRIPVLLLTGYLGSGKTSLLVQWLGQPELADAALVINEIGEVGVDDRLVGAASESVAGLVANACVCCTGLPGLEEAMADLYWARLQRRIPRFSWLVIETTGLANPRPVAAALQAEPLLRERYRLAGVVATVSGVAGIDVLQAHEEARAQVAAAGLVVVTKVDEASPDVLLALRKRLRELNPDAPMESSARGAWLSAAGMLSALGDGEPVVASPDAATGHVRSDVRGHEHAQEHEHEHGDGSHAHDSLASFVPCPMLMSIDELEARLAAWKAAHGSGLLRIKGIVEVVGRGPCVAQWSIGDEHFELQAHDGDAGRLGLTLITACR